MTTTLNYTNPIYQTTYDDKYSGVVMVGNGTHKGTGSLLYDGRTIITAAHIFDSEDDNNKVNVYLDTANGFITLEGTLELYDQFDSANETGDLALITLDENIDASYNRYELYRDTNEIGQEFTMAGYGNLGTGDTGEESNDDNIKLITQNTFDADMYEVYTSSHTNLLWTPEEGSSLTADFDNGSSANDAFDTLLNYPDTGVGDTEGLIAAGDSGGPAFIDYKVAGIASYVVAFDQDINDTQDASFGEIAAWQRVSYYQEWIDKEIRSNYENTPTTADEVETTIIENDTGIQYTYFLLEVIGDRSNIDDIVTWNYTTVDGTATANEDYIPVEGTLTLYADESSIIIPVEILGDNLAEADETFYLELSNTSYDGFTNSDVTLTAMRTIIDDDGYIA